MPRGRAAKFELNRDNIRHHAADLFATRGYTGASMQVLAQRLDISKALLYHYYTEKYQLLVEIAEGHIDRLEQLVATVSDKYKDPTKQLVPLMQGLVEEYAEARAHHQVLVQDIKYLTANDRRRVRAKERRVVAAFATAIAARHPELERSALAKPLTMLLFGMINWLFTWFKPNGRLSYHAMAELVAEFAEGGLTAITHSNADARKRTTRHYRKQSRN
jgi:TetR/AcrR family transcriptional regulator